MNTADSNEDYEGSYPPSKNESRSQSKQDLHTIGGGSSVLDQPVRDLLVTARTILELGLKNVSSARQVVALNDGKSIADISWSKVGEDAVFGTAERPLQNVVKVQRLRL